MDAVLSFFLENYPWFAVVIIAIVLTWFIATYVSKLEQARKKIHNLPCEKHKDDIKTSSSRYENLQSIVESTNNMVVEVSKWIMKYDNDMIEKLAKKSSPLKMTSLGCVLFEKSTAKSAVDGSIDFLIKELEKEEPKTAFDVEQKALSVLLKNIGSDMFNGVKQFLYYSPDIISIEDVEIKESKDIKLSIQLIIQLMGIYLRDKYLQKYPEIE